MALINGNIPLQAVSVEELLLKDIKPREMLLDPILPEQGLAMLYSYRGIGKTFFALGIGLAVASGGRFLCWTAPRPRSVLYIDGELPARTLQDRCNLILVGMLTAGSDAPDDRFRIVTPDLQDRPMPDLSTWEGQELLEPLLDGVDLVLLDNLSALCRNGSENEGEDWLPVQQWALDLRRRGISVLFVHHAGKNKSQRGTSRREDLLDTVITLKHPSDYDTSEGLRCEVHFEKTRAMLGESAKPFEVQLTIESQDQAIWTVREIEDARLRQARELFSSGLSVRDVADTLGISKSTAGRHRQKWDADRVNQHFSQGPAP
jgi:putative DNA primase/helicase